MCILEKVFGHAKGSVLIIILKSKFGFKMLVLQEIMQITTILFKFVEMIIRHVELNSAAKAATVNLRVVSFQAISKCPVAAE